MRWPIALVLLSALAAQAHDADLIYALVKHGATPGVLVETVTLTAPTLGYLAPLDADGDGQLSQSDLEARHKALKVGVWEEMPLEPCQLLETRAWLREGFIELEGQFRCPDQGELRQDFKILRVLPPNYRVVLGSQFDGEAQGRGFAQGSLTAISVPRPLPHGSWDVPAFRRAFDEGVQRGLSREVLGALLGLLLSIGAWRPGLLATALALAGVLLGSWASAEWWPPTLFLLLVALGAAGLRSLPVIVPLLLGVAIGLRDGGGPWPACLGLGAGTSLVLLLVSPVSLAVAVMLQRRPRLLRVLRWAPPLVVLISAALHARLSA